MEPFRPFGAPAALALLASDLLKPAPRIHIEKRHHGHPLGPTKNRAKVKAARKHRRRNRRKK